LRIFLLTVILSLKKDMGLFKTIFKEMAPAMGMIFECPPRDLLWLILAPLTKMDYHYAMKGIKHTR